MTPTRDPGPEAAPAEMDRIVPKAIKIPTDLVGLVPGVGNVANVAAAGMSSVEVLHQLRKGDIAGVKTAGGELLLDALAVAPVVGNLAKGGKVLKEVGTLGKVAKDGVVIGKDAMVTEKFLASEGRGVQTMTALQALAASLVARKEK